MNGCPCEPNGTDGLTCPDNDGRLLCQTSPSRARPSTDLASLLRETLPYVEYSTARSWNSGDPCHELKERINQALTAPEARAGDCDAVNLEQFRAAVAAYHIACRRKLRNLNEGKYQESYRAIFQADLAEADRLLTLIDSTTKATP